MPITAALPAATESEGRLSERVYQSLLEAVLSGALAPGEVVSELSLAKAMKVSRTPVHDAVVQLTKDGLLRQEPNRRPVVASFTADDVREVFEVRAVLEGEAAALAAPRIDRPTLAELRATADRLDRQWGRAGWLDRWADFDEGFHAAVARACGNGRLCQEVTKYRTLHRGLNKTHTAADVLRPALAEHLRILDALDRRDPDAARTAMTAHIREWQAFFVNRRTQET
ncbi:family transcriptional regulator : Uncharacterized protein OS=Osedax symbiont Rs2 GN=OFPI_31550 PE=4 SV=1: GntR: FCD [Gemmataceae bacterium]|nr:family transcriptional regulator : Uncharacterized protein OS=Osedax symbiont Rs2 GN=OFPI_31550 PE=4 SV=1: GntR: FCD [Gemmataceae bacterium]VTT99796.1 family transcriptional regulator : Uncharacterized protein OS=Osedax symbiont Rs2 GN=OFPI_31550 PE=4 SV=1: GntR: FCD [Gemmataceae bacterium]